MITFKKIRFRNFLSSGNNFTEITLDKNNTNLIIGSNGSGKSTVLDALCFVLFNKAFRKINKSQMVNSVNGKDCFVEIDFSIGNREYKISRGIKPNIFELWVDGKLQDQSSAATDQQKYIEDNILKLNYKSFTQIVILGSASFVPFMQLSSSNRRDIVEDLLDIKIFSSMNSVIKEKIRSTNDNIKEFELVEKMIKEKISMQFEFIENIEKTGRENIENKKNKIEELELNIENLNKENLKKEEEIKNNYQPKLDSLIDCQTKLKKLSSLKGKLSQKIVTIKENCDFFNQNTVCPICTQKIKEETRLNKISESEEKIQELQKGYDELKSAILDEENREIEFIKLSKEINSLNNEISNNNVKISQFIRQNRELEQEVQDITNKIKNRNSERTALSKLKIELEKTEKLKIQKKENILYFQFIHSLMKDGGIKAKIIKKYLPLMNLQINKYLQMMDLYINFNLDEEFNETIKSPIHEDFTYESFSEGEKMRINLAILFTWREIARMKNSVNTNLLILDEVFDSSLDGIGIEYFIKIIKYVVRDSNIFVISHKTDEMIDHFENVIKFEKIKGFSKISS
jgi:DNA repair exonuclease SbcCD ATPase subunit